HRPANRVDEAGRNSRAAIAGRVADGACGACGAVGAVEKEGAFFDGPTIIAADDDAVYFLNVVLTDVRHDQIPVQGVEAKAIRVAQPVGISLGDLARALERVARRDAVLAV